MSRGVWRASSPVEDLNHCRSSSTILTSAIGILNNLCEAGQAIESLFGRGIENIQRSKIPETSLFIDGDIRLFHGTASDLSSKLPKFRAFVNGFLYRAVICVAAYVLGGQETFVSLAVFCLVRVLLWGFYNLSKPAFLTSSSGLSIGVGPYPRQFVVADKKGYIAGFAAPASGASARCMSANVF